MDIINEKSSMDDVLIIGDNFLSKNLIKDFKIKPNNNIDKISCIIDCTFNLNKQLLTIENFKDKTNKIIILNHNKRKLIENPNLIIIQVIIPEIYGYDSNSFYRSGFGNNEDSPINYGNLINECIRRIHDNKLNFIPNTYINYYNDVIKYIHIDNVTKQIQYIIKNIKNSDTIYIYDEEKNINNVINTIKNVIGYDGNVISNCTKMYHDNCKKLNYNNNYKPFYQNIKQIYNELLKNNSRFTIHH